MENEKENVSKTQLYEAVVNEKTNSENYHLKQLEIEVEDEVPESNTTFLYISAITVNFILFSCTSCLGWSSPVISSLESRDPNINPLGRPVTPLETSWIASLLVLGASLGPVFTAKLGDLLGRKKAMIFLAFPHIFSLVILAYATDVRLYYVTRFVSGFVMGSVMGILPVYLSEIAEARNRHTTGSLISISLTLGILYSIVIGPLVSVKSLTLLCALPAVFFVVLFSLFIPESPVYLVAQGNVREASIVLRKLRGQTDGQVQPELRLIMRAIERERQESQGNWNELFKDVGLRRSLAISLGLLMFLQLSGVNPFVAFLGQIIEASGTGISTYTATNVAMFTQALSAIVTTSVVEKYTKKSLLFLSALGSFACHGSLSIYLYLKNNTSHNVDSFSWLPIAAIVSFFFLFNTGLAVLPWSLTSEIFPTAFRSTAVSMASFVCFLFSFVLTLGFPLLVETLGLAYCFWFFASCMLMCALFVYCLVPETEGKTPSQIQELLRK